MNLAYELSLFLGAFLFFALMLKLAAWLQKYRGISWAHTFICSAILFVISIVVGALSRFAAFEPPDVVSISVMVALFLGLCGWFYRNRGLTAQGTQIGWIGGIKLGVIAWLLMVLIGAVAGAVAGTIWWIARPA